MGAKRHERSYARRCALQMLYQSEILDESPRAIVEAKSFIEEEAVLTDYVIRLVEGVETNKDAIDVYLKDTSENWSLARMPIVDKSILRLALYEMIYVEDVPLSVSINEAVELAKDFGGEDDSPRFVNGVLGYIAKLLEDDDHGKSE
ncbi:MAG: transcription antitermination factor NusB [Raoultibacter sp.]|jgi:N utilization substance protein B